ncbi:WYL domain-containing protein [Empedobacter falsenii]
MKNDKFNKLVQLENLLKKDIKLNTKKYLAKQLNVDIKTILNYLNELRNLRQKIGDKEYAIEIGEGKIGREKIFYYVDKRLSIKDTFIIKEDLLELKEFQALIKTNKIVQNLPWVGTLNARLNQYIDYHNDDKSILKPILYFDEPKTLNLKIQQHLDQLYHSIRQNKVVKIGYKKYNGELKNYKISPYFMKEHKYMWYLYGYNHSSKATVKYPCLALDRISSLFIENDEPYENLPKSINSELWFANNLGITINDKLKPIQLKFRIDDALINYLSNYPIDESQRIEQNLLFVKLIPNYELEQWILGYGEQIEVIEPLDFRKKIKKRIESQYANYK